MSIDPYELWRRQKRDEGMRQSTVRGLGAAGRAGEITDAIGRREREARARARSEQASALLEQMRRDRAFIVTRLASCASLRGDEWRRRLDRVDLAGPGAEADLRALHRAVEEERALWSIAPGRPHGLAGDPFTSGPFGRAEQRRRAQEREREDGVLALGLIASLLETLISSRELYAALTG
jgi:hypothetical protein